MYTIKAMPSLFKSALFSVILLSFLGLTVKAQIFNINTINCKLSNADTALLNKMGRFEGSFYNQVFETHLNDTVVININLYGKHGEYKKVQKEALNTTFIDGFYSPMENRVFIYKTDDYMKTLIHETSHNILRYNYRNPPQWLNEGIATLLGYLVETTDNRILYVPQTQYIKQVKDSIRAHQFSFDNFFSYKPNDWLDKDKRPMLYATSYSIIYFFVNQDKDYLAPMLVLMKKGYSTQNAIKKTFGSLEGFQNMFYDFYMNGAGTRM